MGLCPVSVDKVYNWHLSTTESGEPQLLAWITVLRKCFPAVDL